MTSLHWVIPCPICGTRLRVLEQSYLGRRGRCPSCQHKFLLEVPKAPEFLSKHAGPDVNITAGGTLKYDCDVEISDDEPKAR